MLAASFVEMEIREWIDSHPMLDKDMKEILIELSKRIISSYELYKAEVKKK
jgi:hypothetical protein